MKTTLCFLLFALSAARGAAQPADLPTGFFTCLDDSNFCVDSPLDTMDLGPYACGETFYRFAGRMAFPVLRNVGPVTISLKTIGYSPEAKRFPLYVEIRYRDPQVEPLVCTQFLAGGLVMIADGLPVHCGGVWESVTVDPTQVGVPFNSAYHIQITGLKWWRVPDSPGLACVRVTADTTTAIHARTWSFVKKLYRDATR